jgi:hypothetical protein
MRQRRIALASEAQIDDIGARLDGGGDRAAA